MDSKYGGKEDEENMSIYTPVHLLNESEFLSSDERADNANIHEHKCHQLKDTNEIYGKEIYSADGLTVDRIFGPTGWLYDLEAATFTSLFSFKEFADRIEHISKNELRRSSYNTFTPFIRFYEDYKRNGHSFSLLRFISNYKTTLWMDGLSCVGLSILLMSILQERFPSLTTSMAIVSCEQVKNMDGYCIESPNNTKEHVLIAIKFLLKDYRSGFVILEPGYHVGSAVIVMEDGKYPHTGWFTQSSNKDVRKEYCYEIIDQDYISWKVKEKRKGVVNEWFHLIYVKKAFGQYMDITEKRSLCYSFKSMVIRDKKGPIAGIYCWMKGDILTIFYPEKGGVRKVVRKFKIEDIGGDFVDECLVCIAKWMPNKNVNVAREELGHMLRYFKRIHEDREFMEQVTNLDDWLEDNEV